MLPQRQRRTTATITARSTVTSITTTSPLTRSNPHTQQADCAAAWYGHEQQQQQQQAPMHEADGQELRHEMRTAQTQSAELPGEWGPVR